MSAELFLEEHAGRIMPPRKKKTEPKAQDPPFAAEEREAAGRMKKLERWRFRVAQARKARSDWTRDFRIEEGENFFLGNQLPSGRQNKDGVFNHYRATVKVIMPSLVIAAPKFIVRPRPGQKPPAAENTSSIGEGILESVGNQDQNLELAARLGVFQSFFRVGVMKVVFDPKPVPNPRAGEPIMATIDGEAVTDDNSNPIQQKNPLTGEVLTEPDEVMTDNVYRYEWVDARNLLLPDEGPDPQKWTWIGEEVTVSLEEAKADTRFPERLRDQLESNIKLPDGDARRKVKPPNPHEDGLFQYAEIYDIKKKEWLVMVDGQVFEQFLVEEPVPPGIEDHPYAVLSLGDPIMAPEPSPWPLTITHDWVAPQRSYNANRKQVDNGSRRAARKGYYTEGMFATADEAVKAMESADDMAFAMVNDIKETPVVQQDPPLSADIYRSIDLSISDLRVLAGQTGARQANPDSELATEALFAEQAASLRDADNQRKVGLWLTVAGKKMFQLVQATLTFGLWTKLRGFSDTELQKHLERVYKIPVQQQAASFQQFPFLKELLRTRFGQERWRRITREELTFEADVTIEPGSSRPKSTASEQRLAMQIIPAILTNPGITKVPSLLRRILRAFDWDDEQLIEELQAVGDILIGIQSNVAGRDQQQNGASSSTAGAPDLGAQIQGIVGGLGG